MSLVLHSTDIQRIRPWPFRWIVTWQAHIDGAKIAGVQYPYWGTKAKGHLIAAAASTVMMQTIAAKEWPANESTMFVEDPSPADTACGTGHALPSETHPPT